MPNESTSISGAPWNAGSSQLVRNSSDGFENGRLSRPPTIESPASATSGIVIVDGDSCGSSGVLVLRVLGGLVPRGSRKRSGPKKTSHTWRVM